MNETRLRERMAEFGRSLFQRGYGCGSSGNISVRLDDGILVTPTNSCLGMLDPAQIAKVDWAGRHHRRPRDWCNRHACSRDSQQDNGGYQRMCHQTTGANGARTVP